MCVWKRIIQVLRRYIMLWGNIFQKTELIGNHSCPSITGFGWPGIRFKTIAARPFCSRIEALFTKWPVFSPSSCAVWRARALPSFLNCSRATLCQPPRDSATMGMNLIPCSLHSSSVFLHLLSNATVIACPGVAAAPALVAAWRGWVMVISRAASSPPALISLDWVKIISTKLLYYYQYFNITLQIFKIEWIF